MEGTKKRIHFIRGFQFWIITLILWFFTKGKTETAGEMAGTFLSSFVIVFLFFSLLIFVKRKIFRIK